MIVYSYYIGSIARKLVFRVFFQVQHKPVCIITEDGFRLKISASENRRIAVAKRNMLISCVFAPQLICIFIFLYTKTVFLMIIEFVGFCFWMKVKFKLMKIL